MGLKAVAPPHAGAIWRERLGSAFRTAMACTIIGCTALYGPYLISHQIQYPSVAYVTAILIVSDATLGTGLRGSWQALCATVIVVPSTVLCLSVVGPSRFTEAGASVAVTLSAFVVSLPECLPVLTKRIAYVQLVIIYVGVVVRGHAAGPVTHPLHIAACTALGASGSILALILPFPRLAVTEVKKHFQSYTENASIISSLYLKAFLSEHKSKADDLIAQAEPIAQSGTNLLDHINQVQEGVKWERHRARDFKNMETPIKGMKTALSAISSFPVTIDEELKTVLRSTRVKQMLKLEHAKRFVSFDEAVTVPERKDEPFDVSLNTLVNILPTHQNLPVFFFLSCFELLINNSTLNPKPESVGQKVNAAEESRVEENAGQSSMERVVFALKCSIALGLAVLLGMFFDKKNGYWSGLTIAISFVEGRLPIFTVANNRVQGTAFGAVYGVLGSCLLHQLPEIRFIILLPWIVFTSMLHHSRMFGESGGIAAVIGALLILGRKNYGPPKQFAIARLTEVSIGLFCMVLLEVILQPVRAATVVKMQVSRCLGTLDECINQIANPTGCIEKLKSDLNGLKKSINIANAEPSFWFLPFKASCYDNTRERLSKMVDLMQIMVYNMESISSLLQSSDDAGWKEVQELINNNLGILKETTSLRVKCLQKITLVKSNETFDRHLQESEGLVDLESGSQLTEAVAKVMDAFVQQLKDVTDKIQGDEECKRKLILHLNSFGFCIGYLVGETMQVEKCVKEIIRCENPKPRVEFDKV